MNNNPLHPLNRWQSQAVTNLLIDFYRGNFELAGLDPNAGEDYVKMVWEKKNTTDYGELIQQANQVLTPIRASTQNDVKETNQLQLIPLEGVETFLDFGANTLRTINYLVKENTTVKKFIGVDVIPLRVDFADPDRTEYIQIEESASSLPIAGESIDMVHAQFLFHHLPTQDDISRVLQFCHRILRPRGKLVIWEESFNATFSDADQRQAHAAGIATDMDITQRFYALDTEQRFEFIVANDWLVNVNNPHLRWTDQYRPWDAWKELLDQEKFTLEHEMNLGLRISGHVKQGVHMLGIFTKR